MIRATLAALLSLTLAAPADAGLFHHRRHRRCAPAASSAYSAIRVDNRAAYPATMVPASASPQPAGAAPGDFLGWLNATRAANGVGPVGWDPALASMAAANSAAGFTHATGTNPGRQNVGSGDLGAVSAAWMASPPHASALLDPRITRAGLANVGGVWTFNGR